MEGRRKVGRKEGDMKEGMEKEKKIGRKGERGTEGEWTGDSNLHLAN